VIKTFKLYLFPFLSGVLLALAWPNIGNQAWLIFIALVPILLTINECDSWRNSYLNAFLSFFIWHIFAVGWMYHSTAIGSISAWVINSALMALVVTSAFYSSKKIKQLPFEIFLIFFWLSFEILHLFWDLKWPWMNLGHAFANHTKWVQWYEYLGTYGGTGWVLLTNALVFRTFINLKNTKVLVRNITVFTILMAGPIAFSYSLLNRNTAEKSFLDVVVLQPNIDTYKEKFDALSPQMQGNKMINMLAEIDSNALVILPETAIPVKYSSQHKYPAALKTLADFSVRKKLNIIGGFYYQKDSVLFNTAFWLNYGHIRALRNKIKLLPYAEIIPFGFASVKWEEIVSDKGGATKSLGKDRDITNFQISDSLEIGVLICFESIFTDIVAESCKNGADALFIITNDDWWHNSPGHRQHFNYARLKAIENRKWIVRSANTGISGVIDHFGEVIAATNYRESKVLISSFEVKNEISFFSKNEQHIRYAIMSIFSFLLILILTKLLNFAGFWIKNFRKHLHF
jgi:apolipoprotein N-acyltransferase